MIDSVDSTKKSPIMSQNTMVKTCDFEPPTSAWESLHIILTQTSQLSYPHGPTVASKCQQDRRANQLKSN